MSDNLKQSGILGMKWGHRMSRDGSVTTLVRGKRVPKMTTRHGKPVQVNRRALSNSTRKLSTDIKKKFIATQKRKKLKELLKEEQHQQEVKRLSSHLMTGYLTLNASKWANELSNPKSSNYNEAYASWLANG